MADSTDEGKSNISLGAWEQRRIKDEIKSFLKQIILEVGGPAEVSRLHFAGLCRDELFTRFVGQRGEEEYPHVEAAYILALQDLHKTYAPDESLPLFYSRT